MTTKEIIDTILLVCINILAIANLVYTVKSNRKGKD